MKKKRNLSEISKLSGGSLDIKAGQVEKLKSLFPQTVKDGEIDFDALKLALGSETDTNDQSYGLSWAGKADCFRHIQEATTATLRPDRKESVDFDNTENIFIEGDNLEVLKVLQKNYYGKVKMIYIDPPYNTGKDSFIYPDRFKEERAEYEERAGIKDAEGLLTKDGFFRKNSKDTGHFHSNWLCMMYPRLFLVRNLLRDDGVIFVSIDDNEVHNLRMIMNEIFGEENFVAQAVRHALRGGTGPTDMLRTTHDYVLIFAKNKNEIDIGGELLESIPLDLEDEKGKYRKGRELNKWGAGSRREDSPSMWYPIPDPDRKDVYPIRNDGTEGRWRWGKKKLLKAVIEKEVIFEKRESGTYIVYEKVRSEEATEKTFSTLFLDKCLTNATGTEELKSLFEGKCLVDYPKPLALIYLVNKIANLEDGDIVLDFFAGSGTTAHAVMQLNAEDGGNRKYICVQLAEPCDEKSEAFKAGFKTIADIGKERIRRAGKKIKKESSGKLDFDGGKLDLGFKVFKLDESNFKQWRADIKTGEELKEQMKMFVDNKKKGSAPEDMLYEIILKNSRFDLNVKLEKKTFGGIGYYNLTDGEEIICLADKITKKLAEKILKEKPQKFTCLDTAFKNNDQLKTNTALQMEAENIEFKVI